MVDIHKGHRETPLTWELDPLDLSIQQYEQKCKQYHYRSLKKENETNEERTERLSSLAVAKAHLDAEYLKLFAIAQIQG